MSNVVFVKENENIYDKLIENDLDIRGIKNKLKIIAKKVNNNNKIGYFQFKIDNEFIKICVIPKVIDIDDKDIQEKYLTYINKYFKIVSKYKNKIKLQNISDNYLDVILSNKANQIESFESLLNYKYMVVLDEIEGFFKRYKKYVYKEKQYKSHDLKFKIDIKKNITEINKSLIHQYTREEISYSMVANITLSVIKYFSTQKINSFENSEEVKKKVREVSKLINKRFEIRNVRFNINKILTYKARHLFSNKELKILYRNLLLLLDLEGYFEKNNNAKIFDKINNMTCVVFNPELIFEYYVYDKSKLNKNGKVLFSRTDKEKVHKKYIKYGVFSKPMIRDKDNVYENFKKPILKDGESKPDLIVDDVVIDCKWKILNELNDIKVEDILKLKRDCLIRNCMRGVLVYPLIEDSELKDVYMKISDKNFKDGIFVFSVEECKVIE